MNSYCVWAQVAPEIPFKTWWTELCGAEGWNASTWIVERWVATEVSWGQIFDSMNALSLFRQDKALVVQDAERLFKGEKNIAKLIERLSKGPNRIIFQSKEPAPKASGLTTWSASFVEAEVNDRAAFQWIDAIHAKNMNQALGLLDQAIHASGHPFGLLQLIQRDFRLGRLIHHAQASRLKEAEMSQWLKVPSFVIQKWIGRRFYQNTVWSRFFDRLWTADLELKSGQDPMWVLKKLTYDLIQLSTSARSKQAAFEVQKALTLTWQPKQLPWQGATSYV